MPKDDKNPVRTNGDKSPTSDRAGKKNEPDIDEATEVVEEFVPEDGEGNEMAAKNKLKKLREELKKCQQEKQDYLLGWQKERADAINRRKKDEEERKDFIKFSNEGLITELTTTLDTFDMAMGNKETWGKPIRIGGWGLITFTTSFCRRSAISD